VAASLTPLFATNTLAPDNRCVANNLRQLADEIEAGRRGAVDTLICLLEAGSDIERITYGKPIDLARVIGLMYMGTIQAATD
jgi:hypothetical protein